MKRRTFLKGISGAALAAPFLPSLAEKAARAQGADLTTNPRAMVIFYTQNGCLTNRWFPKTGADGAITSDSLMGTTLEGLAPHASKLLFPRGLAMFPRGQINGYFDPHDQGMGSKLTCTSIDPDGDHWALGRSLDHVAADLVNQSGQGPLVLSVGNVFANVKGILSYTAAREPYEPESNPKNVYSNLTGLYAGGGGEPQTEADYRVAQGNSIIDLVRSDLESFQRLNMSANDERKVDDWLSLLRETEQQVVSAACNADSATGLGIDAASVDAAGGQGFGFASADAFTQGGDMMLKLIALTLMCDANRSIIMQWPGFVTFNWDGIEHEYDHHGLSHRNGSAAVGGTCVSGVIDQINQIDQWYAGRYSQLVSLIDSIQDGEQKLLDRHAVMWLPELADGNAHNNNNLPIVIAGSANGYLKQGVSVNVEGGNLDTGDSEASCAGSSDVGFNTGSRGGEVPINKLYVTLLNAIGATQDGAPIAEFGAWDSNDGEGITDPGELTQLKA